MGRDSIFLVNHYTYDPWGMPPVNETYDGVSNLYRFANYAWDNETQTYYCINRIYDPVLWRFTSKDPIQGGYENPMTLHRYLYVTNNPINDKDPTGEMAYYGLLEKAKLVTNIVNTRSSMMTKALELTDNPWDASIELEAIHNMHAMVVVNKDLLKEWYFVRESGEDYIGCMGRCVKKAATRQAAFWFGVGSIEQLTHNFAWGKRIPKEIVLDGQLTDMWWLTKKMQTLMRTSPTTWKIMSKIIGHQAWESTRFWGSRGGGAMLTFGLFGTALAGEEVICAHRCK